MAGSATRSPVPKASPVAASREPAPAKLGPTLAVDTPWLWSGARWWKVDFHAHSMASFDYGNDVADEAALKGRAYSDWLLDFMRAGIDCVIVADHNSGRGIDEARRALAEMEANPVEGFRPLVVIPGVELTVNGGTHITAVLPMDAKAEDVDRLLGSVGYTDAAGSSSGVTRDSIPKVIEAISAAGGFAIAAHADGDAGLYRVSTATLLQALATRGLAAVELERYDSQPPEGLPRHLPPRAVVAGSDSHYPTGGPGQSFPGSRYTWVKLKAPTTEGIRLALLDGPLSLLRSDQAGDEDPNRVPSYAVLSVEIANTAHVGVNDPLRLSFSPWLNSIIGGRGTGKSTVVELIRLALDRLAELPDALAADLARYRAVAPANSETGLLRNDTVVRVEYVKEGAQFRVTWRGDTRSHDIEQITSGAWGPAQGDIAARFPIRIYSQKQIFHLAGDGRALLKIVDEASPVNRREWQEGFDAAGARFLALRARAREIESSLSREGRIRGELDDTQRRIQVFESTRYAEILRTHRARVRQSQAVDALVGAWENAIEELKAVVTADLPREMDSSSFDLDSEEYRELKAANDALAAEATAIRDSIVTAAGDLEAVVEAWKTTLKASNWSALSTEAQRARDELVAQLTAEGIESPQEHAVLLDRQQQLQLELEELEARRTEAGSLRIEANELLASIHERRRALTQRRRDFLAAVLADNKFVRVHVVPYGATDTVETEFRTAIGRDDQNFPRLIGRPGSDGLLRDIGTHLHRPGRTEASLQVLKTQVRELAEGRGDRATYSDTRFTRHLEDLDPERLDRLDLWFPEDSLSVTYSPGGTGANFVSIGQASPGEKTATLLAFLLSYGSDPMVLDQPEDDLDNRLIADLIVTQLRATKRRRQVIVVTHNANIVVNGDAETVTSLESQADGTRLEGHGCLQEPGVRELVCRVMEGGLAAFEARYRRITLKD